MILIPLARQTKQDADSQSDVKILWQYLYKAFFGQTDIKVLCQPIWIDGGISLDDGQRATCGKPCKAERYQGASRTKP